MAIRRRRLKRRSSRRRLRTNKRRFRIKRTKLRSRGMNRIRKYRFSSKNIGGDKCYAKLRYVTAGTFNIAIGQSQVTQNVAFAVGASTVSSNLNDASISGRFGTTPNLSTLASLYQRYRIRGVRLKLTVWPTTGGVTQPICVFMNAASSQVDLATTSNGPSPAFPPADISVTPEQRWSRSAVIRNTGQGANPTKISAYYSVDKVQGPDKSIPVNSAYYGTTQLTAPFWSDAAPGAPDTPINSPWLEFGMYTMSGGLVAGTAVEAVIKAEATVYTEFWGKRSSIQ